MKDDVGEKPIVVSVIEQIKLPTLGDILELIFFRKRMKIEGVLI